MRIRTTEPEPQPAVPDTAAPAPEGTDPDHDHTRLIAMLDQARRAVDTATVHTDMAILNRTRFLDRAHQCGMSVAEIAEYAGMSESGVRKAIQRARSTQSANFDGAR